jgi:anti-sigma factor RsiW
VAQDKRHLTTEQLSALLDKEASAEEQAQWEAHLSTCPQCQRALTALRQTVAMLHALPQPMLPRSFVLSMEVAEPIAQPVMAAPTPLRPARRRMNPYVRGVLRTVSALAAIIGVVFFFSGIGPTLIHGGATATTSAGSGFSSSSPANSSTGGGAGTKASNSEHPRNLAPRMTATAIATAAATEVVQPQLPGTTDQQSKSTGVDQQTPSGDFTFLIFNLSTPAGRVGLGMILVLLGGMGLVLFKRVRRA